MAGGYSGPRAAARARNRFILGRIALEELVDKGFTTLIEHEDTAVKIIVHP